MLLDVRVVSRKTPLDGKLEISEAAAARLALLGPGLVIVAADQESPGAVEALACTCGKREGGHVHHFVTSPSLRGLREGDEVHLDLDPDARRVAILLTKGER